MLYTPFLDSLFSPSRHDCARRNAYNQSPFPSPLLALQQWSGGWARVESIGDMQLVCIMATTWLHSSFLYNSARPLSGWSISGCLGKPWGECPWVKAWGALKTERVWSSLPALNTHRFSYAFMVLYLDLGVRFFTFNPFLNLVTTCSKSWLGPPPRTLKKIINKRKWEKIQGTTKTGSNID